MKQIDLIFAKHVAFSFVMSLFVVGLTAQISNGGQPKSFIYPEVVEVDIPTHSFDKPDREELLEEDELRDRNNYNLRDAVAVPIGLNMENSGTWFDLSDGGRLWRMRIRVPEAYSLEAYYDQFYIPFGGEFFVYNEDATEFYGAYTERNNKNSGRMATEMIQGEVINFEYYEPSSITGTASVSVQDLAYRYRNILGAEELEEVGGSQPCEVNVNCSEGDDWLNQINSVVRVRTRINGQFFWCSGAVMNNTDEDCRPLLLTALHCALDGSTMSNQADLDLYRFYFKYQAIQCGTNGGPQTFTITGCTRLADSNDGGGTSGSDFLLLEMSTDIPASYNPFYAGWNASSSASTGGGVSVHHPAGDVKKISTFTNTPSSSSWGAANTHWLVNWVGTTNGHGVTEGGSSGSPLFNASGQVIGTLTGGASYCNEVQANGQFQPDFYGKMSHHWSNNPNPNSEKLREFLDPSGQNTTSFSGSSDPCGVNSIEELDRDFYQLYPNPSNGLLSITLTEEVENPNISISDVTGSVLFSLNTMGRVPSINLELETLVEGVYFLTIRTQEGYISTKRFIIAR